MKTLVGNVKYLLYLLEIKVLITTATGVLFPKQKQYISKFSKF